MSRKRQLRNFGLTLGALLALVGSVFLLLQRHAGGWMLAVGALLAFAGLVAPGLLAPLEAFMLRLGHLLGRVTTPLVLTLLYWLVLVPVALLARLAGKRFMPLTFDRKESSYWQPRSQADDPEVWRRQF